jgi:hypothetical protein
MSCKVQDIVLKVSSDLLRKTGRSILVTESHDCAETFIKATLSFKILIHVSILVEKFQIVRNINHPEAQYGVNILIKFDDIVLNLRIKTFALMDLLVIKCTVKSIM